MRIGVFLSLLFMALPPQPLTTTRQPLLSLNHFGGEGGPIVAATRDVGTVAVFADPWKTSEQVGTVDLKSGRPLRFDGARTVVYRFGEAEILPQATEFEVERVRLEGERIVSQGVESVRFSASEKLDILCYHAEGHYYLRKGDRTFSAYAERMRIHREPQTETWIHLTSAKGWIQVDGELIQVVDRRF